MAEVLVRAGQGRSKYVSILSDRWRFQILPFDSRAAIEAAELIAQIKTKSQSWATWAKVKFDIQIVSIAKAENATVIYADDKDIENLAKRVKIPCRRICDLPLPPPPEPSPIESGPVGEQIPLIANARGIELGNEDGAARTAGSIPANVNSDDERPASSERPSPTQNKPKGN